MNSSKHLKIAIAKISQDFDIGKFEKKCNIDVMKIDSF
jgi:hypothetical protein